MTSLRSTEPQPHDLLTLNNLPHTTLTTHPHLLRTRRQLIVSRRVVPRSALPPAHEPDTDARSSERTLKRFQLLTKTPDPAIGKAYLAISDEAAGGETLSGKKRVLSAEEAAVERWFDDEDWERDVGRPDVRREGRWRVVGGMGVKV